MKLALLFALFALSAPAATNAVTFTNQPAAVSNTPAETVPTQTNHYVASGQMIEQLRDDCLKGRRSICGKILKVLPDGLVIESGYTNLYREPVARSWLVPGTVAASRAANLVEGNDPGSICIGLIFLTDYPKSRRAKPRAYDYVIIEGYPAGQHTYTSVGKIQRTVRRFSASLSQAVKINFQAAIKANPSPGAAGMK